MRFITPIFLIFLVSVRCLLLNHGSKCAKRACTAKLLDPFSKSDFLNRVFNKIQKSPFAPPLYPQDYDLYPDMERIVVDHFQQRLVHRASYVDYAKKRCCDNPIIALCASEKSGKSFALAGFPNSSAYRSFASSAVVAKISFSDQPMQDSKTFGLLIVYSVLAGMGYVDPTILRWSDFAESCADSGVITGLDAVSLLHLAFGKDRRLLLMVDDFLKTPFASHILLQLRTIACEDDLTDVVVSCEIAEDLSALARDIGCFLRFEAVPFLPADQYWPEFDATVQSRLLRLGLDADLVPRNSALARKIRLLKAGSILASGHPGTVQELILGAQDVQSAEWAALEQSLLDQSVTEVKLLEQLVQLSDFARHFLPTTDRKVLDQLLLTTRPCNVLNCVLTKALRLKHAGIHSRVGISLRATTTLPVFFQAVQSAHEGAFATNKAQYLKVFFPPLGMNQVNISELWVRARGLSMSVNSMQETGKILQVLSGVPFRMRKHCSANDKVRFITADDEAPWQYDTLTVDPSGRRGWHIMATARDKRGVRLTYLEAVEVASVREGSLEAVCRTIKTALTDRFNQKGKRFRGAIREASEFERLILAFTHYTNEDVRAHLTAARILEFMQQELCATQQVAAVASSKTEKRVLDKEAWDWERAIRFVSGYYGTNVVYCGRDRLEETMPPVLLPIASLVRALNGS